MKSTAGQEVGILIADGVKAESIAMTQSQLTAAGAAPRLIGVNRGMVRSADGQEFEAAIALERAERRSYRALVLPDGDQAVRTLAKHEGTFRLIKSHYGQGNAIFVLGASTALLDKAGLKAALVADSTRYPAEDQLFLCGSTCSPHQVSKFIAAITEAPAS